METMSLEETIIEIFVDYHRKNLYMPDALPGEDLSMSHFDVLYMLSDMKALPMSAIAKGLGHSKTHITTVAAFLEARGLLKRSDDPDDRRVTLLSLTAQGQTLFDEYKQLILESVSRKISVLSEEEIHLLKCVAPVFSRILHRLPNMAL